MVNADERACRVSRGRLAVALAALALLSPGCKTWHSFKDRSNTIKGAIFDTGFEDSRVSEKLAAADALYAAGQYSKALSAYRGLADNKFNSTDLLERARFMQAECRYMKGEYPEAVDTYHKLLLDFPTGAHRRDSCARMFEICDYWLDDFRTELTRRSSEDGVLRWHPDLLKNPLDKTKPWVGQEGRTLEALDRIWTHDVTGPTADKALFWCGYVNYVRGNFQEADHFFSTLVEMHKDSPLRPQAVNFAIQSKNNSTGGSEYDSRKCAEALQLIHLAEASIPEVTQNPEMADKMTRARTAIRYQQADKDMKMAEYYERTGHPGSAVFYYELVRRRYAGTRYSDAASVRKEHLIALMKEGKPATGNDPFKVVQTKWKELFGKKGEARPAPGEEPPTDQDKLDNIRTAPPGAGFGGSVGVDGTGVNGTLGPLPGNP